MRKSSQNKQSISGVTPSTHTPLFITNPSPTCEMGQQLQMAAQLFTVFTFFDPTPTNKDKRGLQGVHTLLE
jgi:hypothetical protein